MNANDWQTEEFERHRRHLRAVAYRMLGSLSDADDVLQETWLRLSRSDADAVENMRGWLTTVVARLCLDELRARQARREEYAGSWLPEPVVTLESGDDPEHEALLADSVGLALLVVLETLGPAERLAFVLHDMFALPFEEIAPIVGRTPVATRQLASRARRRVQGAAPDPDADLTKQRAVSTRSWLLHARATSTRSSPCSTPTSSSVSTAACFPPGRASRWLFAAPPRWRRWHSPEEGVSRGSVDRRL